VGGLALRLGTGAAAAALVAGCLGASASASASARPLRVAPGPVTDGPVTALARHGGRLYVAGAFTHIGPRTGPAVALDPARGQVVRSLPAANGPITVAIGDGAGGFFVGGSFSRIGDVPRRNLAHVLASGPVDPGFAPEPDREVFSLLLSYNALYVGGDFASIGGRSRNQVAALDPATGAVDWQFDADVGAAPSTVFAQPLMSVPPPPGTRVLGCRLTTSPRPQTVERRGVLALAASGGRVYLGGSFATVNGIERQNLAAVSASTGQLALGFDPDANNPGYQSSAKTRRPDAAGPVDGMAISGSSLYLAGGFTSVAGRSRSRLAKLDAATGAVDAAFDPLPDERLTSLTAAGNRIYAAGTFGSIGGAPRSRLAALDAGTGAADPGFHPVVDGTVQAVALAGGRLYLAGSFGTVDGVSRKRLAAVDAVSGQLDSGFDPNADDNVNALAVSGGTVFAGGFFNSVGGLTRSGLAALRLPGGEIDAAFDPRLGGGAVASLAASASRVYATLAPPPAGAAARVTFRRARTVSLDAATGAPATGFRVRSGGSGPLAVLGRRLYVAGLLDGRRRHRFLTALDARTGANDSAFRPHLAGTVSVLLAGPDRLFVGGTVVPVRVARRTLPDDAPKLALVALDPVTGLRVSGFHPRFDRFTTGPVTGLAIGGKRLFASGDFSMIDGRNLPHLAALDVRSGALDRRFRPRPTFAATQLAVVGSRLYMNASERQPRALRGLDARTGRPNPTAAIPVNGSVCALNADGPRLHVGGDFSAIAGTDQPRLATLR
jgi:outer membrane protein assembly factor BamB